VADWRQVRQLAGERVQIAGGRSTVAPLHFTEQTRLPIEESQNILGTSCS
jgi:hypothetical protein